MKRIRRLLSMALTCCMMALTFSGSALAADGSTISKVSITLHVSLTQGETLPDLSYGSSSDDDVSVSSSAKYEITDVDWTSSTSKEVTIGNTYTMRVTLAPKGDYYFKGSYGNSNISVSGGTYSSASRKSNDKLVVTVKTKPVKGEYDPPDDAYWQDRGFGKARWDKVDGATTYDVWLYRGSSTVYKVNDYKGTSIDFYPYMTKAGTYSFKVRTVPSGSTAKKYASKSDWTESDEVYISSEDASDGSGQVDYNHNSSSSSGSSSGPGDAATSAPNFQVGWIRDGNRWWYRYPDGNFQKNGWANVNGQWYLFDSDGWMVTGWQQRNDQWFYLADNGSMVTGWLHASNGWYYMNPTKDSFEGAMVKGWINDNGQQYYTGSDGLMYEGWREIDGQWYYFYPGSGNKAVNTRIGDFYVDQNGIWQR